MPADFWATIYGGDSIASIVEFHNRQRLCAGRNARLESPASAGIPGKSPAKAGTPTAQLRHVPAGPIMSMMKGILCSGINSALRRKDNSLHNLRLLSTVAIGVLLLAAPAGFAKEPVKYHHGVIIRFEGEIRPGLEAISIASWTPPRNRAPTW